MISPISIVLFLLDLHVLVSGGREGRGGIFGGLGHQGVVGGIEYVSTQWLGNQLSLPIEYVSTVGMLVLQ